MMTKHVLYMTVLYYQVDEWAIRIYTSCIYSNIEERMKLDNE